MVRVHQLQMVRKAMKQSRAGSVDRERASGRGRAPSHLGDQGDPGGEETQTKHIVGLHLLITISRVLVFP